MHLSAIKQRYFEDIAVAERFASERFEVTETAMKQFASEFDPQPFHLDDAVAAASDFAGMAASGWYTAAVAMRLFVTGELQFAGGAIGLGVEELRWPNPVRAGDRLQLETEILEVRASRSKPNRGIVRLRNVATNQRGEIVLSLIANAMVQRRPAS
jgi:acyl dehydratase